MEWQAIVLVMQILMLAVGWFLFQQARGELSARAAETPVLGEVKALQRSIKQLLADLEQASSRASSDLEHRCQQARELAEVLDTRLETLAAQQEQAFTLAAMSAADYPLLTMLPAPDLALPRQDLWNNPIPSLSVIPATAAVTGRDTRRDRIFALADDGHEAVTIARQTGMSEGEVETMLGLRLQRA